ncbi:TniQ family protein [Mycolicibacterium sp.]|uniref:TniQ family protein n=1 Tax=Mycolicibacterium sp. TaxID=2320850 RepID=UPI001A1ADEF1|nr:TniQ family protein [Mycolicibacterium sp.]MBJ7336755.1 TniQ family protein [Mycolicibacterium sp.]
MVAVRTLPIRVAPLPGEAIDSWLHASAARMGVSWGEFRGALGLTPARFGLDPWVVQPLPREIASIAAATDVDPASVAAMTLSHYADRVLKINGATRRVTGPALWRGAGSPYCPQCLTETGGRWLLRWRTGWSFACVTHRCLLAHTCPACRRKVGTRSLLTDAVPVLGCCANPPAGAVTRTSLRCNADLGAAVVHTFSEHHPALRAQHLVDDLIDATGEPFGVYRLSPQPSLGVLGDLRAVARQVLAYCSDDDLAAHLPTDLVQLYRARTNHRDGESSHRQSGTISRRPTDAAALATGVTAAVASLDTQDVATAGEALRWLVTSIRAQSTALHPSQVGRSRVAVTPVLEAVRLAALAPILSPTAQLRYRTATPMPALAPAGQSRITRLIAHTPTTFWPEWALRLTTPGVTPSCLRPALAVATLLVGTRMTLRKAAARMASPVDTPALSHALGVMSRDDHWSGISTALTVLSDYLADTDIPIDYQCRRQMNYSTLLPDTEWVRICRDTATPGRFAARGRIARGYLFERVSSLPVTAAPHGATRELRRKVSAFPRHLTPELAAALDDHCAEWLVSNAIRGEPVVWQPPLDILAGPPLPGDDPHTIDITALHRMIRGDHCRLGTAARRLNISGEAARYLLTIHPTPTPPLISSERGRRYGTSYRIAKAALTPERFRDLYEAQGLSMASLCARIGVDHRTLTKLAQDYGIPIRGPSKGEDVVIDRDWLYDSYFHQRRDVRALARERGISRDAMSQWLKTHQIPKRPKPGNPPDLAAVTRAPAVLRPALMGNGGWERLCRFVIASNFTSLSAAARHMGIVPSMLVVQINRIEHDLGETLLIRAQRGHPMQLTAEGTRVLAEITAYQRRLDTSGAQ